ncbi:uncharacterized protein DDB_G0280579-like [Bolinopsis microptera]|uniref:uncharacterized protein DDB_G0280579-like n=1 Tax=Bolinopsis microptera TaxID=2820187 RepID=UPI003079C357
MKRQILKSLYPEENAEQPENSGLKEKRRSKKHRTTPESTDIATEPNETSTEAVIASPTLESESNSEPAKKKKKKKKKEAASYEADDSNIAVVSAVNEELADSRKEEKKKTKVVSSEPSETVPSANSQTPQKNVLESKKKGKEKQVKSISQTRLAAYGLG